MLTYQVFSLRESRFCLRHFNKGLKGSGWQRPYTKRENVLRRGLYSTSVMFSVDYSPYMYITAFFHF